MPGTSLEASRTVTLSPAHRRSKACAGLEYVSEEGSEENVWAQNGRSAGRSEKALHEM
jgi:hypothetical protein